MIANKTRSEASEEIVVALQRIGMDLLASRPRLLIPFLHKKHILQHFLVVLQSSSQNCYLFLCDRLNSNCFLASRRTKPSRFCSIVSCNMYDCTPGRDAISFFANWPTLCFEMLLQVSSTAPKNNLRRLLNPSSWYSDSFSSLSSLL